MVSKRTGRTRREWLHAVFVLGGGALLARFLPEERLWAEAFAQQGAAAPTNAVAALRAQWGALPIERQKLSDRITLLSGPGGNVVVLDGKDGKLMVDTFVSPAWPKLQETLAGIGAAPVKLVIDTHWHFDHTDNNAALRAAGATVLAHEATKRRMAAPHEFKVLGMSFPASPPAALPQETFTSTHKLHANGESLALAHLPPAHTDTDIYVHYRNANVLHAGDVFFNGMYPFIDGGTGGKLQGMIEGANKLLALADSKTKIVPGHGPLGDKEALARFRDMLFITRDRVERLRFLGKTMQETVAEKPLADLDAAWGKGMINSDLFVQIAYSTF